MNAKAIVPLVVGLGVGFVALKMALDKLQEARADAPGDVQEIVTASQEIPLGVEIVESMLHRASVPVSLLPKNSFTDPKDVIGRVANVTIYPGMWITESMLAPRGTPPGLVIKVPPGYRAVAVQVDEYTAVGGFLKPGSRVDVIAVIDVKRDRERYTISKTVLQDVEVAAVGQEMTSTHDAGATVTRSVTLIVRAEDAATLHLAATRGKIRLSLRNLEDSGRYAAALVTQDQLFTGESPLEQQDEGEGDSPEANADGAAAGRSWLSQVAAGFAGRLAAGRASEPEPEPAASVGAEAQQVAVTPPPQYWQVEVIRGEQVETLTFASAHSRERVDAPGAGGGHRGLFNQRRGGGRYSDDGVRPRRRIPRAEHGEPAGPGRRPEPAGADDGVPPMPNPG